MGGIWSSFYQVSHGLVTFHMSCLMLVKVHNTAEAGVACETLEDLISRKSLMIHSRALVFFIQGRRSVYL